MGILVLFMLQLWNQPAVRIVGIGRYFEGFVSDPITDLNWNPAALKKFGESDESIYNALQLYTLGQRIDDIDSLVYPDTRKNIFLQETEPFAFFILHPKIGLGFRTGAFVRHDQRNHSNIEQWLYGQNGFYGALNIGKYVKIGGEFNWSWNNQPDEYDVTVWDSLYQEYDAPMYHSASSKEVGAGCIVGNSGSWQISASVSKNWEDNTYTAFRPFWPDDWEPEWSSIYDDLFSFIKLRYSSQCIQLVFKYDYRDQKRVSRRYYQPQDSSVLTCSSFRPGMAIQYQPHDDLFLIGSFIHDYHKYEIYYMRSLIIPAGFEKKLSRALAFRFGTTFMYVHKNSYDWIAISPSIEESYITNVISFGCDVRPYEKLFLYFASEDLLNTRAWFFGLHFIL